MNYFEGGCNVLWSYKSYIDFCSYNKPLVKGTLYFMIAFITKHALFSIYKGVILWEFSLLPHATFLVICVNNLRKQLYSTSMAPMPRVLVVWYFFQCHCIRKATNTLQNVIHNENQCVSLLFSTIGWIVYMQIFITTATPVSLPEPLFSTILLLYLSLRPLCMSFNQAANFHVLINSPQSTLMKSVSSQEPVLISFKLCSSLHCFIARNSCRIWHMPTANSFAMYSNGNVHPSLS